MNVNILFSEATYLNIDLMKQFLDFQICWSPSFYVIESQLRVLFSSSSSSFLKFIFKFNKLNRILAIELNFHLPYYKDKVYVFVAGLAFTYNQTNQKNYSRERVYIGNMEQYRYPTTQTHKTYCTQIHLYISIYINILYLYLLTQKQTVIAYLQLYPIQQFRHIFIRNDKINFMYLLQMNEIYIFFSTYSVYLFQKFESKNKTSKYFISLFCFLIECQLLIY